MHDLDNYKLGETNELLKIATREENSQAANHLVLQTGQKLSLISRELDPEIYNTPEFVEAVKQLILKNKFAEIRILVAEPQIIVRRGHRLVDLAGNLSSFIQLRKTPKKFNTFNENILIVDEVGYLHRDNDERYEAKINFNDRRQSKVLLEQFDEIWEESKPDPNLRRVHL